MSGTSHARQAPGAELPEAIERAILDKALKNAVQENGAFMDQFFLTERQCAGHDQSRNE